MTDHKMRVRSEKTMIGREQTESKKQIEEGKVSEFFII